MGQLNRMGQISPLMEILSSLAARAKPLELGIHSPATSAVRSTGPPGCCVDYVTVSPPCRCRCRCLVSGGQREKTVFLLDFVQSGIFAFLRLTRYTPCFEGVFMCVWGGGEVGG